MWTIWIRLGGSGKKSTIGDLTNYQQPSAIHHGGHTSKRLACDVSAIFYREALPVGHIECLSVPATCANSQWETVDARGRGESDHQPMYTTRMVSDAP